MKAPSDSQKRNKILARNREILDRYQKHAPRELAPKYLVQFAHLTCPATVWKYIEKATQSRADLIMLDLEDSIPRGNDTLLAQGRDNIVRAFTELDWGKTIRTFRPRGLQLDPNFDDIAAVVSRAGAAIDGLIYPKVDSPEEVRSIDDFLSDLEADCGLAIGSLTLQVLIESVVAEQHVFEIACASNRLTGLIFGAFDYWGSLGLAPELYDPDHPIIQDLRCRIVKAAASAGIAAIAEMTLNYPTRDKTEQQKQEALDQCRRDAQLARFYGFAGKWTGIPAQTKIVQEVFGLSEESIEAALKQARAYLEAEAEGKGAVMIDGKMADRATDRINRVILKQAYALGRITVETAKEMKLI